jgi:hypothetical protein
MPDYIPQSDGTFLEWSKTLLAYVSPKLAALWEAACMRLSMQSIILNHKWFGTVPSVAPRRKL